MRDSRRLKVLHVCTVPITAQAFVAPLAAYLQKRGFDVAIACSPAGRTESGQALEALRARFRVITIPIPRTIGLLSVLRSIWVLYRLIRREQFDIVHTQTAQAGFIGRAAARLASTPVIVHTAHAFPFHAYLPEALRRLYAFLERMGARWSDLVMVDSDAVRAEGLRYHVAPPEKIVKVHMGVDLDRFSPKATDGRRARSEWGIRENDLVVGAVARLVPDKGLDCLIEAAAQISPRWPDLRLLIVGGGPLKEALERQAQQRGIGSSIIFAGVRSDVPRLIAAMDLFVLPTRREGFGVVFAEAMAMGKPVIGSAIPPLLEVVGDKGEAGILLPPDAPVECAAAIGALLNDAARRRAMGVAGRRRVEQLYDQRRMFERVESEYWRLLAERQLARADIEAQPATRSVRLPQANADLSAKRAMDVTLAVVGLGLSWPVWLAIAAGIWLEDGFPIFFRQTRIGWHGRLITVLKFRSMRKDQASAEVQAKRNDPRITLIGKILRRFSLDELPQLWSILRGEMSFVGPRAQPEVEIVNAKGREEVVRMREVPGFEVRQLVRPGLTGIAQLYAPREVPHRQKFRYDLVYVQRLVRHARLRAEGSNLMGLGRVAWMGQVLMGTLDILWLDIRLILRSVWVALRGRWEV